MQGRACTAIAGLCFVLLLVSLSSALSFQPTIIGVGIRNGDLRIRAQNARYVPPLKCITPRAPAIYAPTLLAERDLPYALTVSAFGRSVALRATADDEVDVSDFNEALVDFKGAPCLVQTVEVTDKAEILQLNRKSRKAKLKDLQIVLPGPVRSWELMELEGKLPEPVEEPSKVHAELLSAAGTWTLSELAEKLFKGKPTHLTAWAAWKLVLDGLYFSGTTQEVSALPAEKVATELEKIRKKKAQEKDEVDFVKRVRSKAIKPGDVDRMKDLEDLALNRSESSSTLKILGIQQTPSEAHKLLLELGVWDSLTNPWPARFGVVLEPFPKSLEQEAILEIARAQKIEREDLRALEAFAIDDVGIEDPDDAISVERAEGDMLQVWVHVADVGAVVRGASGIDLAARRRGATCYLPNGTLPMLPPRIQKSMGLGLAATSPALSVGFELDKDGHIDKVRVTRSTVRVTRKSYKEASELMEQNTEPWSAMQESAERFRDRRLKNGAVGFQMPQADVHVRDGKIDIRIEEHYSSRELVMEFMLMAGEAAAQFALDNNIPFLFSTQGPLKSVGPPKPVNKNQLQKGGKPPPKNPFEIIQADLESKDKSKERRLAPPETLAAMFEFRKRFDRSRTKTEPGTHTGLGMSMYCQISSPLRRYSDLVLHQQLHAFLDGAALLSEDDLMLRVEDTEEMAAAAKKAERFSSQFYTLSWLQTQGEWKGQDLAFFANVRCKQDVKLDGEMSVELSAVRLVDMKADLKHTVDVQEVWNSEEAAMHKQNFLVRKQVGTRMDTSAKRQG